MARRALYQHSPVSASACEASSSGKEDLLHTVAFLSDAKMMALGSVSCEDGLKVLCLLTGSNVSLVAPTGCLT